MKIANVKFTNYWKTYAYYTEVDLEPGAIYEINVPGTDRISKIEMQEYISAPPEGITLKTIIKAKRCTDD